MNGWALGGILCVIYSVVVGGLAFKKSPGLFKLVRVKLGKNMSDKTAQTVCYVAAGVVLVVGIVFFILGAR